MPSVIFLTAFQEFHVFQGDCQSLGTFSQNTTLGGFIFQMPGGVPVATVALNGAKNAGILAAQIIGSQDAEVLERVIEYKEGLKQKVLDSSKNIKK